MRIKFLLKKYLVGKMTRIYHRDRSEFLKPITKYLTENWFTHRTLIDIWTYASKYKNKIQILTSRDITLSYSAVNFYKSKEDTTLKTTSGKEYVAVLSAVQIIGGSNLIILDDEIALYDLGLQNVTENVDYSDEGIVYKKKDKCVILASYANSFENGIFLGGNYSSNYYHLLYEFMVKFNVMSKLCIDKSIPLLVDEVNIKIPQYKELLGYLNTDNREIISVEKRKIYQVEKLTYISFPNFIPPNYIDITKISASSTLFNADSLMYLRNTLLSFRSDNLKFSKKLFISRKNASNRRSYNEVEVFSMLRKYEFAICFPEEHSIAEQIELFNNAEIIIGATGAAFTNILFCNPQCKIICLTNYGINLSIFSTIAKIIGTEMTYFFDESLILSESSDLHSAFSADVIALEEFISNIA